MDTLLLSLVGCASVNGQQAEPVGAASYSSRPCGPACVHTVLFAVRATEPVTTSDQLLQPLPELPVLEIPPAQQLSVPPGKAAMSYLSPTELQVRLL